MLKSVYKSEAARDKFRAHYNGILNSFPFRQQYVDTAFGRTFMLTAGSVSNPPVILLHGSCSNSAFWFTEITALSANYCVYAVDIVGEAGNSAEFRPDLFSNKFALWLSDVLNALGLDRAIIIGNSLGGWMALKFATQFPQRVSKLGLIAAAGIAAVRKEFTQEVEKARAKDGTVPINSTTIGQSAIPKEVLDFMNLISESYDPIQELPIFSDDQLRCLSMPVLFIDGEHDVIIDAQKSAQRLTSIIPSAEIHLLQNCGHVVLDSLTHIVPFLLK